MKLGPNVKKLLIEKMSIDAVPNGEGVNAAIKFLSSKESVVNGMRSAAKWVEDAINTIRKAGEPNPWKNATDEEIAGEILRRVKNKKEQQ